MPLLNSLGSALGLGQGPSVFPSIAKSLEEGKLRRGDPRLYKQMQDEEKEKAEQEQYAKAAAIIFEGLKVYGDPQKALQDPTVADAFSFFVKSNDPQRLQSLKSFLDIFKERPKYDKTQMTNMRSALEAAERRGMNFPVTEENRELLGTMGYNPLMQSRVAGGRGDFATDLQTGRMMNQEQYIPGISPKPQGTFYQQDPSAWEEQQRKQAQIKQEYRTPPKTTSIWVYDTQLKKTIRIPENRFDPARHEYPKTGGEGKPQYRSFNGQLIKINPDGSTQTVASPSEYTKAVKLAQSTDAWKLASTTEDRDQIIADMLPQAKRMKTNVNQPTVGGTAQTKKMTPEIAAQYLKKYGTRQKAEEAARKDNYVW